MCNDVSSGGLIFVTAAVLAKITMRKTLSMLISALVALAVLLHIEFLELISMDRGIMSIHLSLAGALWGRAVDKADYVYR